MARKKGNCIMEPQTEFKLKMEESKPVLNKWIAVIALQLFLSSGAFFAQESSPPTQLKPQGFMLPNLTQEQVAEQQKAEDERLHNDWANLAKYREDNGKLPPPTPGELRVVFMGDSITAAWGRKSNLGSQDLGEFFPGKRYINRGISGQTSPQMLVRFRQDVIDLHPRVVVILSGTNDIAENTGKTSLTAISENIESMTELAQANRIDVVLCSVLPAKDFWWHHDLDPAPKIRALNEWIHEYAKRKHLPYVDYYSRVVNDDGGLKSDYSPDGVHPNSAGYAIMAPLAEAGIAAALNE
jgi:lysophospholipase L1-like esterase